MKSYEEIAASALERGREYETRMKAKRRTAGRVCLCSFAAVALIGLGAWQFGGPEGMDAVLVGSAVSTSNPVSDRETSPTPTDPPETGAEAGNLPLDETDPATTQPRETGGEAGGFCLPVGGGEEMTEPMPVISSYGDGAEVCYAAPQNGQIFRSIPLSGAMNEYGDTVRYNVRVDVFKNGEPLDLSSPEVFKMAADFFSAQDIISCIEDYFDGQEHHYTLSIHASFAQLQKLTPPEGYGFMLFLRDEQQTDLNA